MLVSLEFLILKKKTQTETGNCSSVYHIFFINTPKSSEYFSVSVLLQTISFMIYRELRCISSTDVVVDLPVFKDWKLLITDAALKI